MDIDSLAQALFGSPRAETQEVATDGTTRTYMGVAMSDSEGGTVVVDLGGDVTLPDDLYDSDGNVVAEWDGVGVEMSTSPQVLEGEDVIVTLVGGSATKKPMVTAVAGAGDRQGEAIDEAARAAEVAWNWADDAHVAAAQAQEDAEAAALSAASAASSASDAASSASTASASAQQAVSDASTAATAATNAQASAANAESAAQASAGSASAAATSASQAQTSAGEALTSAQAAQASAASANANATAALNSLATVEDVVDTLSWITQHGTMAKTTDTAVDPTKVYFVRDNSGDYAVGNYRYSIVQEPVASGLSDYYELTIDKSVQNYIATHLSLTSEGLWLTPTASNAYKVLVATGSGSTYTTAGTYIIDGSGATVAQFTATGISFAQNKSFYIGDSSAYIQFDGNGHISIGGSGLTIGGYIPTGGVTVSDLTQAAQDATLNSNISVGGRNLVSSLAANWRRTTVSESSSVGTSWEYMSRTASTTRISAIDLIPVDGDFVTVSLVSGYDAFLTFFDANGYMKKYLTWSNQRTVDLSNYSGVTAIGLTVRKSNNSTITLDDVAPAKIKLEKGNVATDWTPAPEDVDSAISNASKTATSYVTDITGGGIMVHPSGDQNTGVRVTSDVDILRSGTSVANYGTTARIGTSAGKHVSIDSDSVDLMDGNASLATFGANDTHIGMSGTGNVYMANDKFLLSAETSEGEYEEGMTYTQVESGFKAQNLGENYHVYSGLNSKLNYNDDGGYTASDTYIDAWVEDNTGHELHRAYVELWADPLYQTAIRLYGDSVELNGKETWYVSPYNEYPLQLGKPVVRSANKSMSITSTNTWVDGPSVYLDQGQWLVVGVACFNTGSSSGNRKLRAQLRLDTSVYVEGTEVRVATNEYGRIQATAVMTVGSADGLDATLVLSSSMSFTTATTSYVTAVQLA